MKFFNNLTKLITGSVGNNSDNKEEDVRIIRRAFKNIGFTHGEDNETDYEGKPLGIITGRLDSVIKNFQHDNDLREDGYIYSDGGTEGHIIKRMVEDRAVERESLSPPKRRNIPGTNIPDRGIPEGGRPGGLKFDPFNHKRNRYKKDPYIRRQTPKVDKNMKIFKDNIIGYPDSYEQDS